MCPRWHYKVGSSQIFKENGGKKRIRKLFEWGASKLWWIRNAGCAKIREWGR